FCIILILPTKTAALGSAREVYTGMKELANKYKTDPVKLVYITADKNPDFASAFGFVSGSKEELLIAYRPKRKRYERLSPPLTKASVEEFIDKVLGGLQLQQKINKDPSSAVRTPYHDEL
ncbi:DnaJ domain-containing protein, putative, partial [Eimeria maxima]